MRRLAVLFAWCAVTACGAPKVVTFDFDFSNNPVCTAAVTTSCYVGFQVGIYSANGPFVILATSAAPPNATGLVVGLSFSFNLGLSQAPQTIAVVSVARDQTGAQFTSDPAKSTTSGVSGVGSPVNVKVTP